MGGVDYMVKYKQRKGQYSELFMSMYQPVVT